MLAALGAAIAVIFWQSDQMRGLAPLHLILPPRPQIELYVGGKGASNRNDCLAPKASGTHGPCADAEYAATLAQKSADFQYTIPTIHIACGHYPDVALASGFVRGHAIRFAGAGSKCVTITASAGRGAINNQDGFGLVISGMTLSCGSSGVADLNAEQGFGVDIADDVTLAACPLGSEIVVGVDTFVNVVGKKLNVSGDAAALIYAVGSGANFVASYATINFTKPVKFSTATIVAESGASVQLPTQANWTGGPVTGRRWEIEGFATIRPGNGTLDTTIPGSAPGAVIPFLPAPILETFSPSNPKAVSSAKGAVMMGLGHGADGVKFTPRSSGIVDMKVAGTYSNNIAGGGCNVQLAYGTPADSAPDYDAPPVGKTPEPPQIHTSTAANAYDEVPVEATVTLVPGDSYWVDIQVGARTGGACQPTQLHVTVNELR